MRALKNFKFKMNISDYFNRNIFPATWKSLDRATSFILLTVIIFLSLVYTYVNWSNMNRKTGQTSLQKKKSRSIPKLRYFPYFEIPILEGLYSIYRVQKGGLDTVLKWVPTHEDALGIELYIGPIKTILVTDASTCQEILNSSDPGHLAKPEQIYGRVFTNWLHKGLLNAEYDLWKVDRKIVDKSFTFKSLESVLKINNNYGKNLANRWKELSNKNGGIVQGQDLYDTLSTTLIRTILEFIIGTEQCTTEDISKFRDDFCKYKGIIGYRILHPECFIAPIWWLHPKRRDLDDMLKCMNAFVMQVIERYQTKILSNPRKEANSDSTNEKYREHKCLVESMLNHGASSEQIYYEVGTVLTAGRDTSEIAISSLLFDLALNFDHQVKCREEVDSFFNSKSLDSDFDLHLNMGDLSELKYLERCILESMRLTPPIPFFMRRVDNPIKIHDHKIIERGSNILISPWLFHRHFKFYPNPEKFDPDRFLPENVKRRVPGSYIPFSGGPRNCIGWKAAINQIKVTMVWILRNFEIFSEDKRADVKFVFEINVRPERPYNLILKRRNLIT